MTKADIVDLGMNVSYWAIWTRENASAKRKQVACSGLTWR